MPKLKNRPPSYRLHKASGHAIVTIDGRDHYLGTFGTSESRARYKQRVAQWAAIGTDATTDDRHRVTSHDDLRISELFLAYLQFAGRYYVKNGRPTGEVANLKDAIRPTSGLFGSVRVAGFGPRELKLVREKMIKDGLSRKVINARVNRLRRVFKWGVENQLVVPSILHALQAVAPLRVGRTDAPERDPVRPVPTEHVDVVLPCVSRQVAAMIRLQLLTGMRPGEAVIMRACDLQMEGPIWTYVPASHKTEHYGIQRAIFLGPRAQEVINEFIRPGLPMYLFRPVDAVREFHRLRKERAQFSLSTKAHQKRRPCRYPGEHYTTQSYCYAIQKACKKAGVPIWGPNRLRHNAATYLRQKFGIEAARVVLGHSSSVVTEIYAALDQSKAADIMAKVG